MVEVVRAVRYADGQVVSTVTEEVPEFRTLTEDEFMAMAVSVLGVARLDQLLAKSKTSEALLLRAGKVDREAGNLPAALTALQSGDNALTSDELDAIDAAWRAMR